MKPHKLGLVPAVHAVLILFLWHQAQAQTQAQQCQVKADICFLIDSSGSIRDAGFDNWDKLLTFTSQIVGRFTVGDGASRFGAVVFSETAELVFGLDTYNNAADIQQALQAIAYKGSFTNHADALRKARTECFSSSGDRPDAQNIAIIVTDGVPTVEIGVEVEETALLKAGNVYVVAIGITDGIDQRTLEMLASSPPNGEPKMGNSYFTSPSFDQVNTVLNSLVEQTCEAAPPAPSQEKCESQVDLCLVIDSSGSIRDNNPQGGPDNWQLQLQFLANLVRAFTIGPSATKVGAIVFSERVVFAFPLNRFDTAEAIAQALISTQYEGQTTNTPDALSQTRTVCFSEANGDRPNVPNLAIIITDGVPFPPRRRDPALEQARLLQEISTVIAIGITNNIDANFLKGLSSAPQIEGQNFFTATDFGLLNDIQDTVVEETCELVTAPSPTEEKCDSQVDLCLVIDSSGSIRDNNPQGGPDNWQLQLQFLANLVRAFTIGPSATRVGAIVFSERIVFAFPLNRFDTAEAIAQALINTQYEGQTTNTPDALSQTRTVCFSAANGDRPNVPNLAIIITDGVPFPPERRDPALEQARLLQEISTVIAIGITSGIDANFLKGLSSAPQIEGQNFFTATDFGILNGIQDTVVKGTCESVTDADRRSCSAVVDLCFLIDSSGSIRDHNLPGAPDNWQLQLEFLYALVDLFTIGPSASKVGAVVFSNQANLVFTLDSYTDAASVQNALLGLNYVGGTTNTPDGLRVTREQCFSSANGDRANVPNLAIFISDGVPFPANIRGQALTEAQLLHSISNVIAIGVTDVIDRELLKAISSPPQVENTNWFQAAGFGELDSIKESVGEGTCEVIEEPTCQSKVDLCLVIDSSGSIRDNNPPNIDNWQLQLEFLAGIVGAFQIGPDASQIGAIVFSEQVRLEFALNRYTNIEDVKQAILNIGYIGGTTNTPDALIQTRQECFSVSNGDRSDADNLVIIITDGVPVPGSRRGPAIEAARLLRAAGAVIVAVGVTDVVDVEFLKELSSPPQTLGTNYFTAGNFDALQGIRRNVIQGTCETVQKPKCQSKVDLCFIVDSSGSIRDNNPLGGLPDNWELQLQFIGSISRAFNIGPDDSQIGAVVFSDVAELAFRLNQYLTNDEVVNAILDLRYIRSTTNTPEALRVTREQCFSQSNGDRPGIKNLAIMVSDGLPFPADRRQLAIDEAKTLRSTGVTMVAIGVTNVIDEDFLREMSSPPQALGTNYFTATSFDALQQIERTVVEGTCESVVVPPTCEGILDLCFIVDSSGSIRDNNPDGGLPDNWGIQLDFLALISSGFKISQAQTRVGVVLFSNDATLSIRLNQFDDLQSLENAILNLGYQGGTTNTPEALAVTRDECFSIANGDRADVPNLAVFLSDGVPFPPERRNPAIGAAAALRASGVTMVAIGISAEIDVDFLKLMSSPPQIEGENYFRSTQFESLATIQNAVIIGSCNAASACNEVVDLCLVLDAGGSTSDGDWQTMKDFAVAMVRAFTVSSSDTRVGLVTYANNGFLNFGLDRFIDEENTVAGVVAANFIGGGVNTADGIKTMREQCFSAGDRPNVRNVALLITDERSTMNQGQEMNEANQAKSEYIYMVSVGVTNNVDEATIRGYSSLPQRRDESYFMIPSYSAMDPAKESTMAGICEGIRVNARNPPSVECKEVVDMCIIIDSSSSIRDANPTDQSYDNWFLLLNFVQRVVGSYDISRDGTRVGVVVFSQDARMVFDLNRYQTKADIQAAVLRDVPYLSSFTNFADALRITREQCFSLNNGNRRSVPDVAMLITDGFATVNVGNTIREAELTKEAGIHVITVGITDIIDENQLSAISSQPQRLGQTWFKSPDFTQLDNILEGLVSSSCTAPTTAPLPCDQGMQDVCFIIDSSGSIRDTNPPGATIGGPGDNYALMLEFVSEIVGAFPISQAQTHVGVVLFSTDATLRLRLTDSFDKADIQNRVKQLEFLSGFTNTADALKVAREQCFSQANGNRASVPDLAIIVTDGVPTLNTGNTETEANALKNANVEVIAVGITNNVDTNTLRMLSSLPQEQDKNYFESAGFTTLGNILESIIEQACATPAPTAVVPGCSGADADVVFVLDESGSIGNTNFEKVTAFVADVIELLDIETGRVRVGVMTFSDDAQLKFNLNRYTTRPDAAAAVSTIPYRLGRTNTADAIRYARQNMFSMANGARANSNKLMIIITDGESNDEVQTMIEAKEAKGSNLHIMSVGIGNWLDLYELEMMASYPTQRNMIRVQNFDSLGTIVNAIRDAACDNVDECSSNPCRNGRCRNGIRYYWCECFDGWAGVNCDQRCENGGDVVFAVDSSGSIGKDHFKDLLDVVIDITESIEIDKANTNDRGFRVGMVTFGTDATLRFNLGDYQSRPEILAAISVLYSGGTTNTASAIRYIREQMFTAGNGDRGNVPNYIVVLTDGRSDNRDATWREAQLARQAGIHIIAVGIGNGVLEDELRGLASGPLEGNVIQVPDFRSLSTVINTLSDGLCNNVNECNSNPCANGAPCVDGIFGFTCGPCPPGFTGMLCERGCSGTADIVFVIDSSGSIRSERFPRVLEFIESIINDMDVHPERTRIGLVYWSDGAEVGFYLNQYTTREEVIINLWKTPFLGGRTHTSSALTLIRDDVFINSRGDRDLVPNYAIILTDGNSNINPATTVPEAIQDRVRGIHLMVVAVGEDINRIELEGIASDPKDQNIYTVNSIRDLQQLETSIIASTCDDVNECLSNPCQNGGTCIDQLKRYSCQCQFEFSGYNCQRRCNRQLDVAFVLDLSGSIFQEYRMVVDFAKEVVYGLNMQFGRVRVGTVAFATDIVDKFDLNAYQNKEGVINALNFYNKGGRTDTARALTVVKDEFFRSFGGDRSGVNNVVILVSDGYSTEGPVQPVVNEMKNSGIEFYTIGTGDSPNVGELNDIATDPDSEHDFRLALSSEIERVSNELLDQLCQ